VISKVLGVDIQAVAMTMLTLVGLYLVLKNANALNSLAKTGLGSFNKSLVILQGRSPKALGV
jgi:hypothetical protein